MTAARGVTELDPREVVLWPSRREEQFLRHLSTVDLLLSDRPDLRDALPFAEVMWESVRWMA